MEAKTFFFCNVFLSNTVDALSREAELIKRRKVQPERENGRFGGSQTLLTDSVTTLNC